MNKYILRYDSLFEQMDDIMRYIDTLEKKSATAEELDTLLKRVFTMRQTLVDRIRAEAADGSTLERVLDSIDALIYVSDLKTGEILFINKKMEDCFGLKNAKGKICWQVLQEGMTGVCDFCPVHTLVDVNSPPIIWEESNTVTQRTYQNTDRLIQWIDNRVVHIQHSVDITDLKAAIEAKTAAEETTQLKSSFLANMSHEIRTPLNAIVGMSEILLGENLAPKILEYVTDINSSGTGLLGIINDILDFSKIEAGKLTLSEAEYQPAALMENLESIFFPLAEKKNVDFEIIVQNMLPECILGDDMRVRQILVNLISNAIKFTTIGKVTVKVKAQNGNMVFQVSDTGIGIKSEDLPRMYTAFEQFDPVKTRSISGTGLGLPITRSLVDIMHGHIFVESEYGKGTTFTVELPYVLGDVNNINAKVADFAFISAPEAQVLIVDDSLVNLKVAVGLMGMCGINADTANGAKECFEKITHKRYDIVFMDHMMPEMDGTEVTKRLRESGYDDLIIIALTANAMGNARELFITCGMNDFIPKPIDKILLNDMLRKWLPPEKIIGDNPLLTTAAPSAAIDAPKKTEETRGGMIDMDKSINALGEREIYFSVLKTYYDDIPAKIEELSGALEKGDNALFTTFVHSIKSASAVIGADTLSELALKLETASRDGDMEYVRGNFPRLIDFLRSITVEIKDMLASETAHEEQQRKTDVIDHALLTNLYLACKTLESLRIESALQELCSHSYGRENEAFISKVSELIDSFELDEAMDLLQKRLG